MRCKGALSLPGARNVAGGTPLKFEKVGKNVVSILMRRMKEKSWGLTQATRLMGD